VPEIVQRLR